MPEMDLAGLVAELTGADRKALNPARLAGLERRLCQEGLKPEQYSSFLRLREFASEAVSVGETYFYRLAEQFEFLMQRLRQRPPGPGPFRAWSAGCSSGEEAWSLAACLGAVLPAASPPEVLGTDMSEASLALARQGLYGKWSLRQESRGLPPVLRPRDRPGRMEVLPQLRERVRFQRHNLLDEAPLGPGGAQLVFCRHVLIYFKPEAARKAVDHLVRGLAEEGLIFFGSVDLDFAPPGLEPLEPRILQAYRKLPARAARAAAPRPPRPLEPLPAAYDAKAAHLQALEFQDQGRDRDALERYFELRARAPLYLPGLFDLAMALNRQGLKQEAAEALRALLRAAEGRAPEESVDAPEPVSLRYYLQSAQTYLDQHQGTA